jgi:hypothetical membrane protein
LIAAVGDFLICYILALFYPKYNHSNQVMSVLGNPNSPVHSIYNIWLVVLGFLILFSGIKMYFQYESISKILSIMAMVILFLYGIGGCILSGMFSVNETKGIETISEKVHGIGAGLGFMFLAFIPLIIGLLYLKMNKTFFGISCVVIFVLAIILFVIFVMSEKEQFTGTIIGKSGLWQRLLLGCMYIPLLMVGIDNLKK